MMPRLAAEEEILARSAASHPFMEGREQTRHLERLAKVAGGAESVRKPTRADLAGMGIKDVTERTG